MSPTDERLDRLDQRFDRLTDRLDRLTGVVESLAGSVGSLEHLITEVKESLEREIHEGLVQITTRFDSQAVRLDRQGANWQTGRRWSGRMDDWAEKIDTALEARTAKSRSCASGCPTSKTNSAD